MKIKERKENKLILVQSPLFTFMLLGIFVFVLIFGFLSAKNQTRFTCNRFNGEIGVCKLITSSFTSSKVKYSLPLNTLRSAKFLTSNEEESLESQVYLETFNRTFAITEFNNYEVEDITNTINNFINDKSKKVLNVKKDNTMFNAFYFLVFFFIALSFTTLIDFIYCVFDKNKMKALIVTKNILGSKTIEVNLKEVTDVEIEERSLIKGKRVAKQYRVILKLKDKSEVALAKHYDLRYSNIQKSAQGIVEFLEL